MKKELYLSILAALAFVVIGCGSGDSGEYKVEGPKASDNPSIGTPVSSGGGPASTPASGEIGGAVPSGKGAPTAAGSRGR